MNQAAVPTPGVAASPPSSGQTERRVSRPRSVRVHLALLVVVCMLPIALVAAWMLYANYDVQRERQVSASVRTARSLIATVDRELAARRAALFALASSSYLANGDLTAFYAQAAQVQTRLGLRNVVVIDPSGQQRVNTLRPRGAPLPIEQNPVLLGIFRHGEPLVTDLFGGAVTGTPLVAVAVPVWRDGAVAYVLAAGFWPDQLSDLVSSERLPAGSIVAVFDSTGTIVARNPGIERFLGRKGAPELVQRMAHEREGSLESVTVEGIPVYSSFSKSSESGWSVAVGIPKESMVADLRRNLMRLMIAVVLLLALSLAMASLIGRRISASIRALIAPAQALGHGNAVEVPPLLLQEPDEVGRALTQTSCVLQQALHRAQHDALTGLANRVLFEASVEQRLRDAQRSGEPLSVLYIDLDRFKEINDSLGHAVGDELLRIVARRLTAALRASDIGARLGGDEFAVLLPHTGIDGAHRVAEHLVRAFAEPCEALGHRIEVSASIGAAIFPDAAASADELMRRADQALYRAKAAGRNRAEFAAPHVVEPLRPIHG